jgi:hypothetical protein
LLWSVCVCKEEVIVYLSANNPRMKQIFFFLLLLLSFSSFSQNGVVIGGDTVDASAILELRSTSKGFLLPRLTQAQRSAIISPPAGLQIYNSSNNSVEYYNGTSWQNLTQGLWVPDTTGMYYNNGKVAIGTPSSNFFASSAVLTVNGTSDFTSTDTWQTAMRFRNTSVNWEYDFLLGGSGNTALPPRAIALYHASANGGGSGSRFIWNTDGTSNGYFGIGSYTGNAAVPKSRLHVFNGDVNIEDIGRGIIMKSPNGQCWRVTVANDGSLVTAAITCL